MKRPDQAPGLPVEQPSSLHDCSSVDNPEVGEVLTVDLTPPWDEVWDVLQEAFVVLRQRIRTDRLGYQVGFSAMEPWPYREFLGQLTVSADRANQEFEDLVLSLQCAVNQGGTANVLSFIVERGDGFEIAELPSTMLPVDPHQRREITLQFVRDAVAFIEGHTSLLLSALPKRT